MVYTKKFLPLRPICLGVSPMATLPEAIRRFRRGAGLHGHGSHVDPIESWSYEGGKEILVFRCQKDGKLYVMEYDVGKGRITTRPAEGGGR